MLFGPFISTRESYFFAYFVLQGLTGVFFFSLKARQVFSGAANLFLSGTLVARFLEGFFVLKSS